MSEFCEKTLNAFMDCIRTEEKKITTKYTLQFLNHLRFVEESSPNLLNLQKFFKIFA